ncbi:reticulon-like protein B9 [Vitis riparia]|uniref:reticulon-like protein B9 n=1 Tax=Vitis riparia TaxID=96939 RepID=UPI00155A0712|nr:reticulon-like protein B9 [Vitis riparia]
MQDPTPPVKLFGRQRSIHEVLGGGTVADVLLWRNKIASAALLIGSEVLWFLFEVVEYSFVSLLCHILITAMLVLFIWSTLAEHFKWPPFEIPEIILDEYAFHSAASILHERLNQFLSIIVDISCGKDLPLFFLTLVSLWILSVMGNYCSFCKLLFVGVLFLETLPFLYERYEEDVDHHAIIMHQQIKKMLSEVNSSLLNKVPRGPAKEKKTT